MTPLAAAQELCLALRGGAVRFAHWKSNSHLAEALAGLTDLDILVDGADRVSFEQVMAEHGGLAAVSPPWGRYPGIEDWMIFDSASGGFLHLHVHYEMLTGLKRIKHLRLPWKDMLLATVRDDAASGWPIPSAEMELLVLLVRLWAKMPFVRRLSGGRIPRHIAEELDWLRAQTDSTRLAELGDRLGLSADFRQAYRGEAETIRLGRALNAQLAAHFRMGWGQAILRAGLLNLRLGLTRLWLRLAGPIRYRKTLRGPGLLVALVGSDGAGKSTLATDLERWLRSKFDVHLLYMGSGDGRGGVVNATKRRISGLWKKQRPGAKRMEKAVASATFLEKLYRLLDLLLLRRKLRYLRLGRNLARRGSIILTDRYPQMQFNAISDGPRQQEGRGFPFAARAEMKLHRAAAALGPDLVIRLAIDPQTAHRRKPDHDPETLARKCAIVDQLMFAESKMITIDARRAYRDVLLEAKTAIWSELARAPRR